MKRIKIKKYTLKCVSYLYLILPIIIFFLGWLKPIVGISCSSLLIIGFLGILKKEDQETFFEIPQNVLCIFILGIILWTLLAGIGGFFSVQRADLHWRNATFRDLIDYSWPVIYPETHNGLVYYFIFWLVPALFGKLFGIFIGEIVLFLWVAIGLFLVCIYVCGILNIKTMKQAFAFMLIFIVWGGVNVLGQLIAYIVKGNIVDWSVYFVWTDVFMPGLQYTPNNALIEWCYNQVIAPWLVTVMFLENKKISNLAYLGLCMLPYAPLPFCGIFVIFIAEGIKCFFEKNKKIKFWREVFSIQNLCAILSIVPVFGLFYTTNTATNGNVGGGIGLLWTLHDLDIEKLFVFVLFFFIEVGVYTIFLFKWRRKDFLFWIVNVSLIVIPFIRIGESRDFCMRASIPALFILMIWTAEFLFEKKEVFSSLALIVVLTIASIGTMVDYGVSFRTMISTKRWSVPADAIYTFSDKDPNSLVLGSNLHNYLTANLEEYSFFEYICKKKRIDKIKEDKRIAELYMKTMGYPFENGYYSIHAAYNQQLYLGYDEDNLILSPQSEKILLSSDNGEYQLSFQTTELGIAVENEHTFLEPRGYLNEQKWKIKEYDGLYAIVYQDLYALSYKDDKVEVEKFDGSKNQFWKIEKE